MNKRIPRYLAPLRDEIISGAWNKYKNGKLRRMEELCHIFKLDLGQISNILKKENRNKRGLIGSELKDVRIYRKGKSLLKKENEK